MTLLCIHGIVIISIHSDFNIYVIVISRSGFTILLHFSALIPFKDILCCKSFHSVVYLLYTCTCRCALESTIGYFFIARKPQFFGRGVLNITLLKDLERLEVVLYMYFEILADILIRYFIRTTVNMVICVRSLQMTAKLYFWQFCIKIKLMKITLKYVASL